MKILLLLPLIFLNLCCSSNTVSEMKGSNEEYYRSWTGYDIPFRPVDKISKEDALLLETYYVGHFTDGRIASFEKFYKSNLEWRDEYIYHDNGKIKQRKMIKSDGSIILQDFDKRGKLIKQ